MLQAWRDHGAITYAGYIIGFPGDTYESIMRDVEFLKYEIPLDLAEFFIMTPLPGSVDHQNYYKQGVPMDPDTNLYDTAHVCKEHPKMTKQELMKAYDDAWKSFYSKEHMATLLNRRKGPRRRLLMASLIWFRSAIFLEGTHPLLTGFFRMKGRKNRRRGHPIESMIPYYLRRSWEFSSYIFKLLETVLQVWLLTREAASPKNENYMDKATTPDPAPEKKVAVTPHPNVILPTALSA